MSSGGYDGLHPSSSYGHGDSWRPSGSSASVYDRPNYYHGRRRSPSPSRRYVPYDAYYPPENSYRPNSYRPDDDNAYYSRSPSPDHYSRTYSRHPETETWERPEPWGSVPAPWEDLTMGPASPTSSSSKARRDSMLATRMFEPSDAWKQNHVDRPPRMEPTRPLSIDRYIGDPLGPRTPNPYVPTATLGTPNSFAAPNVYPMGDRYRPAQPYRDSYGLVPRADSYRPGWSPSSPTGRDARRWTPNMSSEEKSIRTALRFSNLRSRQVSGPGSNIDSGSPRRSSPNRPGNSQETRSQSRSRRSSSRGRHSQSRSLSRGDRSPSRGRRSLSRGDRSVSRGRRSPASAARVTSSSSAEKSATSGKFSWDRPAAASGTASSAKTRPAKALAQPLQKSSWTRSASRSSIASTHASDGALSPLPQTQLIAKEPVTSLTRDSADVKHDTEQEVNSTDVEMAPPSSLPSPAAPKSEITDVKAEHQMVEREKELTTLHRLPSDAIPLKAPLVFTRVGPKVGGVLPSPPSRKSRSTPAPVQKSDEANGIVEPAVLDKQSGLGSPKLNISVESTFQVPEKTVPSDADSPQVPASAPTPAAPLNEQKLNAMQNDSSVEMRRELPSDVPAVATLPTPVPTPQPPQLRETPPSPPLPESIPTEAKSIRDALRIVVMTRLLCDRQTREERVNPVLLSNLSLAGQFDEARPSTTPEEVFEEITQGPRHKEREERFGLIKGSLAERFKERQNHLSEKVQRLKEEYISLHERWVAHCALLDEQSKPVVPETEAVQPSGRTTRRSTANLGDAVRSDLEMEQIIASLGNDEATDPNHLSLRNLATIPDMVSVTHGTIGYFFDDTNHLVENPSEYYGPHTGIHDWTEQEKEIFLDKFAAHPKQFGMVAEHLSNKTASQCVDYYYLHKKKHIDFRKVISLYAPNKRKRRGMGKKKGNALLADIRQHDAEVQGQLRSPKASGRGRGRKPMLPPELKEPKRLAPSRRRTQLDLTPSAGSATPTPEPEARRRGRRSAAASASRTVSVSLEEAEDEAAEEAERPAKRAKRARKVKSAAVVNDEPSTPEPKLTDQTESISRRKSGTSSAQWSEEDKTHFLTLLGQHGDDFKRIAASMPNKTTIQVSNYYKANADELDLEKVAAGAPKRSPTPDTEKETPLPESAVSTPDPMASLAPDQPQVHTNGVFSRTTHEASHQDADASMRWTPSLYVRNPADAISSASASSSRPLSPSHIRYPYPVANGRSSGPYPSHPMPPPYAPPPPVPYTYPPYSAPRYPQYDTTPIAPHPLSRMPPHPYMPDPMSAPARRMSAAVLVPPMRARENPYPVLPPPGPPYHYSLESS
ncbi:hypothetical protein D9615_005908 [Tricholomella constricta]|uniref:SANT domain-containing protein n=1 Tax=Tricholomella constricta TaxID=117010 RepID=A0A8H5M3A2_9AGAR|nr:hypothetical protein D9615_005908 [Tricholomella constricta]